MESPGMDKGKDRDRDCDMWEIFSADPVYSSLLGHQCLRFPPFSCCVLDIES